MVNWDIDQNIEGRGGGGGDAPWYKTQTNARGLIFNDTMPNSSLSLCLISLTRNENIIRLL